MSRREGRPPDLPRPEPDAGSIGAEAELVGYLLGEGSAEARARIAMRAARDPEVARRLDRLQTVWNGLELPPVSPVPLGFAARVLARGRAERAESTFDWAAAPRAVRIAAASALALGLATGVGLASWSTGFERGSAGTESASAAWQESTLAELYSEAAAGAAEAVDAGDAAKDGGEAESAAGKAN